MRSKWKTVHVPKICFRKNFLNLFLKKNSLTSGKSDSNNIRKIDENTISLGFCKRIRIFKKLNGYVLYVWAGNKNHTINVTSNMTDMFVGSFVFTKRFTREIHKKQIQSRHKKAFNKKK